MTRPLANHRFRERTGGWCEDAVHKLLNVLPCLAQEHHPVSTEQNDGMICIDITLAPGWWHYTEPTSVGLLVDRRRQVEIIDVSGDWMLGHQNPDHLWDARLDPYIPVFDALATVLELYDTACNEYPLTTDTPTLRNRKRAAMKQVDEAVSPHLKK